LLDKVTSFLIFALMPLYCFAADINTTDLCKMIKTKKEHIVLLNEESNKFENFMDLGEIEAAAPEGKPDFIFSNKTYRLITYPKHVVLEDNCSLSFCLKRKIVTPRCQNTNEYLINLGVNPSKFGPGAFLSEVVFQIMDSKRGLPITDNAKFSFDQKATGTLFSPWVEVKNREKALGDIGELIAGKAESKTIKLINKGNRPINIGAWETGENNGQNISIDASKCSGITINENGLCEITLQNPKKVKDNFKYIFWDNSFGSSTSYIRVYIRQDQSEGLSIGVINN
jgi:hypothetical protein